MHRQFVLDILLLEPNQFLLQNYLFSHRKK